ncbi:hypothetical protein IMSHALPRED_009712 [Imshaugia aleurites]|uniref:Uncharacterized protein n=1 Tax=Imshaugia aleurites TaxID=172621 RepID=A0A8H3G0N8_9LECA|nr:hypothetical protein IMSHALPRED_009712 [Imshaugia aleurites]
MANETSRVTIASSLNLGGGLIEIGALTALIGSTTAASLVLGNKGAAGLLWGTMSIFGALSVIKACVAAATPDWLRETLGVRNKETDAAIGLSLDLDSKSLQKKSRVTGAVGVACKVGVRGVVSENARITSDTETVEISRHDVYAFDQCTSGILELVPESEGSLQTHVLIQDAYSRESSSRIAWTDWMVIASSFIKLLELAILWQNGATVLCLVSGCCWAYFLFVSVLLQLLGLSREFSEKVNEREMDIVAGHLPTPIKAGGHHKVLLGAPQNVRHSLFWKFAWGVGSGVCTGTIVATYMVLSRQSSRVFAIWTGFQFAWLALRSVFYHFVEGTDRAFHHPILLRKNWKELSIELKSRVRNLVCALSKFQMHVHPRGLYCYEEDLQNMDKAYDMRTEYPLTATPVNSDKVAINVVEIIGDTTLSSACWMFGSKLTGMELYDSCVLILDVNGHTIAVPSARVLTDKAAMPKLDAEVAIGPVFPLRGNSNTGRDICWFYWIPYGNDKWLQLSTTDMKFLGARTASIVSDAQVTQKLAGGELLVSISEVDHVKEIVRHSKTAFDILQTLLR